jgi:tRNA-dihydrouridine synthase C
MKFIEPHTPALVLAPMDGVTDHLMRRVLTSLMPFTMCVTEFVRVSGNVPPDHVLLRDVPELETSMLTARDTPISLQILGGDPDKMAATAARAVGLGSRAIDINFGCPAPTVNRHDGGATLLKYPERIEAIVRAVRAAVPTEVPVSAKLRLGWDDPSAIVTNAERAARGGASWITIHGRTKMQGYTPPAYWGPIGEVRRALDIPVVANGEIWSLDDLKRCQEETGAIHFMIGRGVLAEPGLARESAAFLGLSGVPESVTFCADYPERWLAVLNTLLTYGFENGASERHLLSRLKQWLGYAHRRGVISWFDAVKRVATIQEFHAGLDTLIASRGEAALAQVTDTSLHRVRG